MKQEVRWNSHLFSHSIKAINRSVQLTQNPQQMFQKLNISPSQDSTPKRNLSKKRSMWGQSRKKYAQMIDEIIKKQVEDKELDLLMTKVFKKHSYKNYRVVLPQRSSEHASTITMPEHDRQSNKSKQNRKNRSNRVKTSNLVSEANSVSEKLIEIGGQRPFKLPSVASPKKNCPETGLQTNDFIRIELKLKKLKQQSSLRQINELHRKISHRKAKTEAKVV